MKEMDIEPYFVYVLECADGTLYTGVTNDVAQRIKTHNSASGASYTRSRRPVTLRYQEEHADKSAALKREYAVKQLTRAQKLELIGRTSA